MQDDGKFSSDKRKFWLQFQDYDDSPMLGWNCNHKFLKY